MSLVSLENVSVSFGAEDVLEGVTCEAVQGNRIGLVGRNGAGKTTLQRVLAGQLSPTGGKRHIARRSRVVLVEQDLRAATSNASVRDEVLSGISEVLSLEAAFEDSATVMAGGDTSATARYDSLLDRLDAVGGFDYEFRLAQILSGLGLPESEWGKPLSALSGGQRSRVALAKGLLAEPDLLILDEPTNHLDLLGLQWLEAFLSRWRKTLIVASHDRYFLDKVVTRVWYLDNRRLFAYPGNYTKFEQLRDADLLRRQKQHDAQQEVIAKEEAFIRRYRAGQRAREARGRAKRLARLERIDAPTSTRSTTIKLSGSRSPELVFSARSLTIGYGGSSVLQVGDLDLGRGEHVALVGPNGSGKTTLLKSIAGALSPIEGRIRIGPGVRLAHYWQEAENLNEGSTALEELSQSSSVGPQQARDLLGRFLFSGDGVDKRVSILSGGERSRLALAKLVLSKANLLLLDEPTNHLDIPSREALEEALASYAGTFIFASHDRRLISRLANRLWVIEAGSLTQFDGSIDDYARAVDAAHQNKKQNRPPKPEPARMKPTAKELEALLSLEGEIEKHENALASLAREINAASERREIAALQELGMRYAETQTVLEDMVREWSGLVEATQNGDEGPKREVRRARIVDRLNSSSYLLG